jgi:hypothetical protein
MTHVLSPPTPIATLRRSASRVWSDPDNRSVFIGLLAVFLVHLFLFALAPYLLRTDTSKGKVHRVTAPKQFNIEISPDAFIKAPPPKPPQPNKYVEANPNAPDNTPDKTNNFSSQNQQLAQEKPQKDQHSDKPKLDGKKDIESNQVVSGQLTKPQDVVPPSPDVAKPAKAEQAARQKQDPLAGFEKMPDGADGFGSNLGKNPNVAKPSPEKLDGVDNAPLTADATSSVPAIDPKHPRTRPTIDQLHTRPAVFQDNQFGTSNIGPIAVDAKWSNYGAYLHKMMEAIQIQWDRILIESHTEPPSGSYVTVKFTMNSKGEITEILDVENTSTEQGKQSCLSAITLTAPYGQWTDDMIAILGNSQEMTFRFYYE